MHELDRSGNQPVVEAFLDVLAVTHHATPAGVPVHRQCAPSFVPSLEWDLAGQPGDRARWPLFSGLERPRVTPQEMHRLLDRGRAHRVRMLRGAVILAMSADRGGGVVEGCP